MITSPTSWSFHESLSSEYVQLYQINSIFLKTKINSIFWSMNTWNILWNESVDKPSSSASGFWTAVHFPQPPLQLQVPSCFRNHLSRCATGCQETEMWRVGTQGARGPPLQPGTVCGRKGDGRSQGVGSRRQRAPPRSVVLGRKSLREGHPRQLHQLS